MNILKLSEVARGYYDRLRAKSCPNGWEKYVCTNGKTTCFVGAAYTPRAGEAVFYCVIRNREVMCQLHKVGEENEQEHLENALRFEVKAIPNLMWEITDTLHRVSIKWREGLFNETQKTLLPENMSHDDVMRVPTWMREVGDYLSINHPEKVFANIEARTQAIHVIDKENWWIAIAAALNGITIAANDNEYADFLLAEVGDYLENYDHPIVGEDETELLMEQLESLSDDEAKEVARIIDAYWSSNRNPFEWARDILWWPAFVEKDNKNEK